MEQKQSSILWRVTLRTLWRRWNASLLLLAVVLVAAQLILKGRQRSWWDLLQVPFALLFSVLLEVFGRPLTFQPQTLWQSIGLFCIGILCTSVGSAMSVAMKLLPNPADGLCHTISEKSGKDLGLVRNIMDVSCVAITCVIGFAAVGRVEVIGVGTIISMVLSGMICGLVGMLETFGLHGRFMTSVSKEFYFDGMLVAMIMRYNPVGTVLMSFFFAILNIGGRAMERSAGIPSELILIVQSVIIFFMAAEGGIRTTLKNRAAVRKTRREAARKEAV